MYVNEGWAVQMDASDLSAAKVIYQGIDTNNGRRLRILINGTLKSDGTFDTIETIQGFSVIYNKDQSALSYMATFRGDLSKGLLGIQYRGNSDVGSIDNDGAGYCYLRL